MLAFLAAGIVVYRVTAPPPKPGEQSRSVFDIVEKARREVRGNRASADVTGTQTIPVAASTEEIRLSLNARSLTILGEDRPDVAAELKVTSNGFDEAEAERLAHGVALEPKESGGRLAIALSYPEDGRQTAEVTLRIPARCAVSIARFGGELTVTGAGQVELLDTRGDAVVKEIHGRVFGSHRGGDLTIADAGALKLTTRGSDVRLSRVAGDVTLESQGGSVKGSTLAGALDLQSNGSEVELADLLAMRGPVRINASGGSIRLTDLATNTRADVHGVDMDVRLGRPAPVAIYSDGHGTIEVTPAAGGYTLDARATNGGEISLPPNTLAVASDAGEQTAAGPIGGGGPTITLQSARGEIVVRQSSSARTAEKLPEKDGDGR